MQTGLVGPRGFGISTAEQVADLLAVVSWADGVLAAEVESLAAQQSRFDRSILTRLESVVVTLRPVEAARAELARLDGDLLLRGAALRGARQAAAARGFLALSLDRR
jgi:hypothetical protein